MKSVEWMGLVGAGSVGLSFLVRMPSLHARLGPVKGLSYPSARRLVGSLRVGYAVAGYSELANCPVIWIWVPEKNLDHVIQELARQTPLQKTMVVLCDTHRDSRWAEPLRRAGARVATLNVVDAKKQGPFVAEGNPETVRMLAKMLARDGQRLIQIRPSAKELYLIGIHLITDALRPWVVASMDALRAAGFTRAEAFAVVEAFGASSLRAHGKAGGKPWSKRDEAALRHSLASRAKMIRLAQANVADIYEDGLRITLEYFGKRKKPMSLAAGAAAAVEASHHPARAVNQ